MNFREQPDEAAGEDEEGEQEGRQASLQSVVARKRIDIG